MKRVRERENFSYIRALFLSLSFSLSLFLTSLSTLLFLLLLFLLLPGRERFCSPLNETLLLLFLPFFPASTFKPIQFCSFTKIVVDRQKFTVASFIFSIDLQLKVSCWSCEWLADYCVHSIIIQQNRTTRP